MMGTMLDAVTVTASRSVVSGAVASGIGNVILRDGFKTWTNQGLKIEPNFPSFQQSSPRQEQWSNYNANLSTPGLSSMPSPSTSLSGSISSYLPSAETLQTGLGVAGWIPGVQTIAGIAEAGVALYRGDYWGAGFATVGAIPLVGYIGKGFKLFQKHHLIPKQLFNELYLGTRTGFKRDHIKNLMRLPVPFHLGRHDSYTNYVRQRIGNNPTLESLIDLQTEMADQLNKIHSQGYKRLNDYYKQLGF
jgi:hypothetical protein